MKLILSVITLLVVAAPLASQSGRRANPVALPSPSPEQKPVEPPKAQATEQAPQVTAEKNQDYRCTDDGTLARILESESGNNKGFLPKEVDTRAVIISKPNPKYTREARHMGVQGYVVLKVLLSSKEGIDRVRVVRRLPFGLTENAIQAACEIKFTPAIKDGQAVAQWFTAEYPFRLADSSIFGP
jgi:TonB family protein